MAADGRDQLYRGVPGHELHPDQGCASGRRGYTVPHGRGYPVPVGGVHSAGHPGRLCVPLAAVLDLHHAENRSGDQVRLVLLPSAEPQMDEENPDSEPVTHFVKPHTT